MTSPIDVIARNAANLVLLKKQFDFEHLPFTAHCPDDGPAQITFDGRDAEAVMAAFGWWVWMPQFNHYLRTMERFEYLCGCRLVIRDAEPAREPNLEGPIRFVPQPQDSPF